MAVQATCGKGCDIAALILVGIVTRGASHIGLLKTFAHRHSHQLVAGVDATDLFAALIVQLMIFAQVLSGSIAKRILQKHKASRVALSANIQLSLARQVAWMRDVFRGSCFRVTAMEFDMLTARTVTTLARNAPDG